jgi:hypothetical protein
MVTLKPVKNAVLSSKFEDILNHVNKCVNTKNIEYAEENDSMIVFNRIAKKHGIQPEKALAILRAKHEESVIKIQNDINNDKYVSPNLIFEKYGDIIIYYILEAVMMLETNKQLNEKN